VPGGGGVGKLIPRRLRPAVPERKAIRLGPFRKQIQKVPLGLVSVAHE